MVQTTLKYVVLLACGVLALASLSTAGDKKGETLGLSGTWGQRGAELKLEFTGKDTLKIVPHGDAAVIAIVCNYTVAKAGLVKAKVAGFEGKEEAQQKVAQHLPVGLQFSFKWNANGDTARLAEVKGDKVDLLKSHLEGEFVKK